MNQVRRFAAAAAIAIASFVATGASAQVSLSVSAGAAPYDLSGTGTSGIAAARVEAPVWKWLSAQAGTGFFWYTAQTDRTLSMLIPQVGLVAHSGLPIPLYLGAGVGHTLGIKGPQEDDFVFYGALGMDIEGLGGWAIRPEMRVHAVDPWTGSIAEFAVGVRRSFGST